MLRAAFRRSGVLSATSACGRDPAAAQAELAPQVAQVTASFARDCSRELEPGAVVPGAQAEAPCGLRPCGVSARYNSLLLARPRAPAWAVRTRKLQQNHLWAMGQAAAIRLLSEAELAGMSAPEPVPLAGRRGKLSRVWRGSLPS
jgi:hypothetical protein